MWIAHKKNKYLPTIPFRNRLDIANSNQARCLNGSLICTTDSTVCYKMSDLEKNRWIVAKQGTIIFKGYLKVKILKLPPNNESLCDWRIRIESFKKFIIKNIAFHLLWADQK